MHTEYDTQTVTNTLALYGVKRSLGRTVWLNAALMVGTAALLAAFILSVIDSI